MNQFVNSKYNKPKIMTNNENGIVSIIDDTITIENKDIGTTAYVYYDINNLNIGDKIEIEFDLIENMGDMIEVALDYYSGEGVELSQRQEANSFNQYRKKFILLVSKKCAKGRITCGRFTNKVGKNIIKNLSVRVIVGDCNILLSNKEIEIKNFTLLWATPGSSNLPRLETAYGVNNCTFEYLENEKELLIKYSEPFGSIASNVLVAPSATGDENVQWRARSNTIDSVKLKAYDTNRKAYIHPLELVSTTYVSLTCFGY